MITDPVIGYTDLTLREAVNLMAERGVTRLPVVQRDEPERVVGLVTLVDLLAARLVDLEEERVAERVLRVPYGFRRRPAAAPTRAAG
jgi:CBS domain-containing protein